MKLVENILTKNPCYTAGRKITVKGLMLHSVGCAQPSASVFIKNWNSSSFDRACVHGFIDGNDGTIYQTLPWDHRGWHAGGAANNTHIGVEMCEPACIKYSGGATFTCSNLEEARACAQRTYNAAVELFAMLCEKYNLDPLADGVIISHAEGAKRGVASNHGDPDHLWRQLGMSLSMDSFRKDVKEHIKGGVSEEKPVVPEKEPENKEVVDGFPAVPFLVKVIIDDLNYRSGPFDGYNVMGQTGKGTFTIVEVKDGWGRLKSGAGWIWLKNPAYCTIKGDSSKKKTKSEKKSIDDMAKEVIRGDWGNGAERKKRLTEAGYDYSAIQNKVNELLS